MTKAEIDRKYGDATAQYVFCANSRHCVDASKTNSSVARYANDNRGSRSNARFVWDSRNRQVNVRATQRIPGGSGAAGHRVAHRLLDEKRDASGVVEMGGILGRGTHEVQLVNIPRGSNFLKRAVAALGTLVRAAKAKHGPAILLRVRHS